GCERGVHAQTVTVDAQLGRSDAFVPADRGAARSPRLVVCTAVAAVLALLLASSCLGRSALERAPGSSGFVTVDGHRMYYECPGSGSPTVVLDAGGGDDSSIWRWVHPQIARFTRVCAYDRAGLGPGAPAPASQYRTA